MLAEISHRLGWSWASATSIQTTIQPPNQGVWKSRVPHVSGERVNRKRTGSEICMDVRARDGEQEKKRNSRAESTVTSVLCLHYDPSGKSRWCHHPLNTQTYTQAHAHTRTHTTMLRESLKYSDRHLNKFHEDTLGQRAHIFCLWLILSYFSDFEAYLIIIFSIFTQDTYIF